MMKFLLLLLLCLNVLSLNAVVADDTVRFNKHIRPILSDKCYFCHGPDAAEIKGKLQLHTLELATSDRDGEGAAIVPGNLGKSLLWARITTEDEEKIMPPPERHSKLTEKEVETVRKWIEAGAEYESLWSFQPLPKVVEVPEKSFHGGLNAIDAFVHQGLKTEGLMPAKVADPDVLLRRVYLSLTGLVPTAEQIAEFKADKNEKAYEHLVDKLLKSQAFAERLAVDWMDLARYADSYGYQRDNARTVWPWRDWVLRSFQQNMPYDQFVHQQLAGDMMPNSNDQMKLATAFNRLHMQKNEGGSIPEEFRVEYVADRAQTAATAFLGLTMECCRCHDHKYDPISQKDYFSTFAFFNNIDEAGLYSYFTKSVPSPSMPVMVEAEKVMMRAKEAKLAQAEARVAAVKVSEKAAFDQWLQNGDWDGAVAIKGVIGEFNFDAADKGKIPNQHVPKSLGTYNATYSKLVEGRAGKSDKGFLLDGDSELSFGALGPFERHRDFSFSLWVNTPVHHKRAVILHRTRAWTDAASRGYELLMINGKLNVALVHFNPGNEIRIQSKEKLSLNAWKQITVTYDGSSKASGLKLYLDGQPVATEVLKDHLTKEIYYSAKKKTALKVGARFRDNGFKKSKVDELRVFDRRLTRLEVRENFSKGAKSSDKADRFAYYLDNESEAYGIAFKDILAKRKDLNEYRNSRNYMMVMKEMPKRRNTYLLTRGLYSTPDLSEVLEPKPPKKVFPFGPEYSRDRLGLAKWLTHPEHPLTARVAVNRYWQMIFGNGLVTTTNDFGSQGSYPSHPEMLDYLSRSFIASGWDMRALVKQIVMSQTFRQDSNPTQDLYEKDPDNKLLARGPSYYLSAEMIRDNALHAAGLLGNTVGGASVKPYDPQGEFYRRSLYTQWKRNDPSPEMLIFGAPRRQVCNVKREKTSTPLQPLVLMNSPQVVESCRNLAAVAMAKGGDDIGKLQLVFVRLSAREASEQELVLLKKLLADQRAYFKSSPEIAKKLTVIGKTKTKQADKQELAAWTVMVNTVMNLDAFYMLR
jgi:hypothetical protein